SKKPVYKLKVRAEASAKSQPITSLWLKVNGKLPSGTDTVADYKVGKLEVKNLEWTIELPEGEHQLNVFARSPDAVGYSAAVRVKHVDVKNLPDLHVLAVGINEYKDGTLDLKYANPDAEAIAKAFKKYCEGEPFRNVTPKTLCNKQATAPKIAAELAAMRKSAKQRDLVIVFFACHGVMDNKEFYLMTHEANTGNLEGTCLSGSKLRKELKEYKCQVLLMMDACHSNGFGAGKKLTKLGLKPATEEAARSLTEDDCGVAVMAAAMANEQAEGIGGYGLFTRA